MILSRFFCDVAARPLRAALLALAVFASAAAYAAPAITSPAPNFDFGERDNDEVVNHAFVVKNAGDEPLVISDVKSSCGCTVAELETSTLQPGEETHVTANFNLKGRQGHQTKTITVLSNDPAQPAYRLELTGTAIATITVEPGLVNFGRIEDTAIHEQTVLVQSNREGHTFEVLDVSLSENAPFTVELKTNVPGKEYAILVHTLPDPMPGALNGRLTIRTDDVSRPAILVNLFGHIVGPLQILPDVINIQANSAPDARPASMNVQVKAGRVKEFELVEVIAPADSIAAEIVQLRANDYVIKLTGMPVDGSLRGKELIVRTNSPDAPELRIPFLIRPERPASSARIPARVPASQATPPARPVRPVAPAQ